MNTRQDWDKRIGLPDHINLYSDKEITPMSKDKETTAEDVLGKNMISLSKEAMELWGFECRQGMQKNILKAMPSPLKTKIEELEKELKQCKELANIQQKRWIERNENLQSSANKLAEALETIKNAHPAIGIASIKMLAENTLTTFRGINKKDNGE